MGERGEPQPGANEAVINKVTHAWQALPDLVATASRGYMCQIGKMQELDRAEVNVNKQILAPVVEHLGSSAKFVSR